MAELVRQADGQRPRYINLCTGTHHACVNVAQHLLCEAHELSCV